MNEPRKDPLKGGDASLGGDKPKPQSFRTALALSSVGVGIFVVVSLLHYHYVLGGLGDPGGLLQGSVVFLHRSFGFVPAVLSFGLVAMWGGIAFLRSDGYFPWRRVGASFFFGLSLSVLTALLGGHGGTLGAQVSARWSGLFGEAFVFVVLLVMVVLSLFLASDWFFVRFLDRGEEKEEGPASPSLSLAVGSVESMPPSPLAEARMPEPQAIPRPESSEPSGLGQAQLVDVAVAEARSALAERRSAKPSHVSRGAPSPAAGREERRARRLARLAAKQRGPVEGLENLAEAQVLEDALVDEIEQAILAERGEQLGFDSQADPFADLDDEELLAKAGLALDELLAGELGDDSGLSLEKAGEAARGESESESPDPERGFREGPRTRGQVRRRELLERRAEKLGREALSAEREFLSGGDEPELEARGEPEARTSEPETVEPETVEPETAEPELEQGAEQEAPMAQAEAPGATEEGAVASTDEAADADHAADESTDESERAEREIPHQAELFAAASGEEASEQSAEERREEREERRAEASEEDPEESSPSEEFKQPRALGREDPEESADEEAASREFAEEQPSDAEELVEKTFVLQPQPPEPRQRSRVDERKRSLQQEALFAEAALSFSELDQAAEKLLVARRPTASLLQRQLGVDHAKARQMLRALERRGAIAAPRGSGPWRILMSLQAWLEATESERS